MSAYAVYGVLFSNCVDYAKKKVPSITKDAKQLTISEWLPLVDVEAEKIFNKAKPKKISILYDAPQFCNDFI